MPASTLHRLQLPNQLPTLLLGWDCLLQLCMCLYQLMLGVYQRLLCSLYQRGLAAAVPLLFGLYQRLLHFLDQRFCCVNRIHSIVFWLRLLNKLDQSRMGVGAGWCCRLHG